MWGGGGFGSLMVEILLVPKKLRSPSVLGLLVKYPLTYAWSKNNEERRVAPVMRQIGNQLLQNIKHMKSLVDALKYLGILKIILKQIKSLVI